jgi:hypothetical protein
MKSKKQDRRIKKKTAAERGRQTVAQDQRPGIMPSTIFYLFQIYNFSVISTFLY